MNKKNFGKYFYHATLLVAIVAMIVALFAFRSDGTPEENERISIIRYAFAYYSFITVLGTGLVVNEYCSGKYVKNKLQLKVIGVIAASIIGAPVFIFVQNATVACAMFFVSLLLLIYTMTPTVKDEKK